MAGEVILGYDGSDGARNAVEPATGLARAFGVPLLLAFGYDPPPTGGEVADLRKKIEERGREVLEEGAALATATASDVELEAILIDDHPAESLVDLAVARTAGFIVVGHRAIGPITGTLVGSVAQKLIQTSPCPVVVVRVPD
jgi:nucleotide-binding universal stress UspA family protein